MKEKNLNISPYYDDYYYAKEGYESARDKNYTQILTVQGRPAQAREFTQAQSILKDYLKRLGKATIGYSNNPFVSSELTHISFSLTTKDNKRYLVIQPGYVYVNGLIYYVDNKVELEVFGEGREYIYAYVKPSIVTELDDSTLYNPTSGLTASGYPGAHRLKEEVVFYEYPTLDKDGIPTVTGGMDAIFKCPFCGSSYSWAEWQNFEDNICPDCGSAYPSAEESNDTNRVYILIDGDSPMDTGSSENTNSIQNAYIATFFKYLVGDCVADGLNITASISEDNNNKYSLQINISEGSCLKDGYLFSSDGSSTLNIDLSDNENINNFIKHGYKSVTASSKSFYTTVDCYPLTNIESVGYYENKPNLISDSEEPGYADETNVVYVDGTYKAYLKLPYQKTSLEVYYNSGDTLTSDNLIPYTVVKNKKTVKQYAFNEETKVLTVYPRFWSSDYPMSIQLNDGSYYTFDADSQTSMPIHINGNIYVQQDNGDNIKQSTVHTKDISGNHIETSLQVKIGKNNINAVSGEPLIINYEYSLWSTVLLYLKAVPLDELDMSTNPTLLTCVNTNIAKAYSLVLDYEFVNDLDELYNLKSPVVSDIKDKGLYLGYIRFACDSGTAPVICQLQSQYFTQNDLQILSNKVDVLTDQVDALIKANADDLDDNVLYYLAETFKDLSIIDTSVNISPEIYTDLSQDTLVGYLDLALHRFTSTNYLNKSSFGNKSAFTLERDSTGTPKSKISYCPGDAAHFYPPYTSETVFKTTNVFDSECEFLDSGLISSKDSDITEEAPVTLWHTTDVTWDTDEINSSLEAGNPTFVSDWESYLSSLINVYVSDGKITSSELADFYTNLNKIDYTNRYSYPGRFDNRFIIPISKSKNTTTLVSTTIYNLIIFDIPSYKDKFSSEDLEKINSSEGLKLTLNFNYRGNDCYFYSLKDFTNFYSMSETTYLDYTYFAKSNGSDTSNFSGYRLKDIIKDATSSGQSTIDYTITKTNIDSPIALVVAMPLNLPVGWNSFTFTAKDSNSKVKFSKELRYYRNVNYSDFIKSLATTTDLDIEDYCTSNNEAASNYTAESSITCKFSFTNDYHLHSIEIPDYKGKITLYYRYKKETVLHTFEYNDKVYKFEDKLYFIPKNTVCILSFTPSDASTKSVKVPVVNANKTSETNCGIYINNKKYQGVLRCKINVKSFNTSGSISFTSKPNIDFNKVKFSDSTVNNNATISRSLSSASTNPTFKSISKLSLNNTYTLDKIAANYSLKLSLNYSNANKYNPPKFSYPMYAISKTINDVSYISKWWTVTDSVSDTDNPLGYNKASVIIYISTPKGRTFSQCFPSVGTSDFSVFVQVNNLTTWCTCVKESESLVISNKDNSGLDVYKVIYSYTNYSDINNVADITSLRFKVTVDNPDYGNTKDAVTIINQISVLIGKGDKTSVTSLSIDPSNKTLHVGDTFTLDVIATPNNAFKGKPTWSSSAPSKVSVTNDGVIKALAEGKATITAKHKNGTEGTASINVSNKIAVTSVTLNNETLTLNTGDTATLKATIWPTTATNKDITWSSSNTKIATVNYSGKVTAKAKTDTPVTISAISNDNSSIKGTCKITIKDILVTGISLNKSSLELSKGASETLTATVLPTKATYSDVTWTSSDTKKVTVDASGKVKAISPTGDTNVIITATTKGKNASGKQLSASCSVKVKTDAVIVTSISVTPDTYTLQAGSKKELTATISPSNATDKDVIWKSSNTKVALVSDDGEVTAIKGGTATIKASATDSSGKEGSSVITVKDKPTGIKFSLSKTEGTGAPKHYSCATHTVTYFNGYQPMNQRKVYHRSCDYVKVTSDKSGEGTYKITYSVIPNTADQTVTWSMSPYLYMLGRQQTYDKASNIAVRYDGIKDKEAKSWASITSDGTLTLKEKDKDSPCEIIVGDIPAFELIGKCSNGKEFKCYVVW